MDAATWGFIGTLVGTVIGATTSISTTAIYSWNASRLQRNADSLERLERARAFQRDNLLELQDALQEAMRFMGRAHCEDQVAYKKSGNWGKSMLSDEVDQNILLSNRKMSVLTERVADDKLRSELKQIHQKITNCFSANSEIEAKAIVEDTASAYNIVMEHLGKFLRSHY